MGFHVSVDKRGILKGTSLGIAEYVKPFTHWVYDHNTQRYVIKDEYFHYDPTTQVCYFPKFDLVNFLNYLTTHLVKYTITERPPVKGEPTKFYMLPHIKYKNDKQKNAIDYLTSESSGSLRGLALQTGVGKTISYVWAIQKMGLLSMTTMTSRLEQWAKEIMAYTTLEEEDIYIIKGVGSLTKLFNQIGTKIKPKMILASTQTMRLYIEYGESYQHLPHPSFMCEKLGISIVGHDETHEHIHTNLMISSVLNPNIFIPITATFNATDPYVKNIFSKMYPENIQFSGGEYERYCNVTSYAYEGGGHLIKPYHYSSPQGYSQTAFEKFLLSKKGENVLNSLIRDAILPIIRNHYIDIADEGEKFLFLCASTKMCDYLQNVFRRHFNSKTSSVFYSGMPITTLEKYDIIISTPGSAGCLTGDTVVSISRNRPDGTAGSYLCTLKNAYLHFNGHDKKRQYNWTKEVPTYIRSYNGSTIQLGEVGDIIYSGVKDVYRVVLANGFSIKCTEDHPIMTKDGWVPAKDIVGKQVMCEETRRPVKKDGRTRLRDTYVRVGENHPYASTENKDRKCASKRLESHRVIYEAVILNKMTVIEYLEALKDPIKVKTMKFVDPSIYDIHHIDFDHYNNDPTNLIALERTEHKKLHTERSKFNFNQGVPVYSEAVSIDYVGEEDTYDIHCLDEHHNFVANGMVVHNTGRDIKNLRTCFAFENTGAENRNLQFLGRLRRLPKNTPEFVYLYLRCIPAHQKYANSRAMLYGNRALTIKHRRI
jgi:hypothetical protein